GFALSPQNNLTPVGDLIASSPATAFIALTHRFPLSDWRRGKANLDRDNGFASQYSLDYLRHNLAGGEGYEWDYATPEDAATQTRTFDPAPTIENGRKYKDIRGWWQGNVSRQTKPIVFVEIAYPSISYGTNPIDPATNAPRDAIGYPNLDTGITTFASDRGCQRAGCEAVLSFYNNPDNNPDSPSYNAPMVDLTRSSVACWDARLYPYSLRPARDPATGADLDHPANPDLAADWETGLQLNGKVARPPLTASNLGKWYFTDFDEPIDHNGNIYEPTQVKPPTITREGTLKTEPLGLGIPFNHPVAELLKDLRSQVPLVLTALRGHIKDDGTPTAFYPLWTGRVVANTRTLDSVSLDILPFSSVLERVGLTRAYTISCPHLLYGGQCKANIERATNKDQAVHSISGADVVMQWPVNDAGA
nr:glycoside hydrolase TIM-barrel-like domain-containing protein [Pseudomonadota bacterium]